jgi:acetoin utilization deacetylase AcuC-like enzyme
MSAVTWIAHPDCLLHEMGETHPESPQRLQAIEDRLLAAGLSPLFVRELATPAPRAALERVHDATLVDRVLAPVEAGAYRRIDPDTSLNAHTARAALLAAGAAVHAVDIALSRTGGGLTFCAVRPPGHHAERARAMGFCFFNNVAVAAAHALASGLSRVAILDFDVHYGNGTADIFRNDRRVLFCSTYEHPLYPGWRSDHSIAHFVDAELSAGAGSEAFRTAVTGRWLPALHAHAPEMILVSAGFDAHAGDPLANLNLQYDDFGWIGAWIRDFAARHCGGRVMATLEGGYDLHALARSVESFVRPFTE